MPNRKALYRLVQKGSSLNEDVNNVDSVGSPEILDRVTLVEERRSLTRLAIGVLWQKINETDVYKGLKKENKKGKNDVTSVSRGLARRIQQAVKEGQPCIVPYELHMPDPVTSGVLKYLEEEIAAGRLDVGSAKKLLLGRVGAGKLKVVGDSGKTISPQSQGLRKEIVRLKRILKI